MNTKLSIIVLALAVSTCAVAEDGPRVFVQGKGSTDLTTSGGGGGGRHWGSWGANSTIDAHDEGMEVTKNLQKDCHGVTVTLNQANADYTLMLNRESKHNRGLLRTNSQVQVANRLGDVLGTSATHTVGNASKDACELILADWGQHGRLTVPEPRSPQAAPLSPTAAPGASPATVPVAEAKNEVAPVVQAAPAAVMLSISDPVSGDTLGDAARKNKQHKECLELARDNPSIVCK
jgi:hypothetical protein